MRGPAWGVAGLALALAASAPAAAQTAQPGRAQVQYSPPPAIPPVAAQPQGPLAPAEIRELLDAAQATAKATRESVDYGRVVPDILQQVLTKLDKLENKLDKIENAVKAQGGAARRR